MGQLPLELDDLTVEETATAEPAGTVIRYTKKQIAERDRAESVRRMMVETALRISLRGKPLCYVIQMWHAANRPQGEPPA